MPTFHTKTISKILDPVAQQVSQLILSHERAIDGLSMQDLLRPVSVVKDAVLNLVKVGFDTIQHSNDLQLNRDMPPCLNKVQDAAIALENAAVLLRTDDSSISAQQMLIAGCAGILNGTSQLLLTLDQSEVRKIVKQCVRVLDFLATMEIIHSMENLAEFIRNLTPILSMMHLSVESRVKELTIQHHADGLKVCLEKLKYYIPLLVSALKVHVTVQQEAEQRHHLLRYTESNRNYIVKQISSIIEEMIRILPLTHEEMSTTTTTTVAATVGGQQQQQQQNLDSEQVKLTASVEKFHKIIDNVKELSEEAKQWIDNPQSTPNETGNQCLQELIKISRSVAKQPSLAANAMPENSLLKESAVDQLESNIQSLTAYRQNNQGGTKQERILASDCNVCLDGIVERCVNSLEAMSNRASQLQVEKEAQMKLKLKNGNNSTQQPASSSSSSLPSTTTTTTNGGVTVQQLVETAGRWLSHPQASPHHNAGVNACRQIIQLVNNEANQYANQPHEAEKWKYLADNSNRTLQTLESAISDGSTSRGQIQQLSYIMQHNIHAMQNHLHIGLVTQVSDRLNDIHAPLRALTSAARPASQTLTPNNKSAHLENLQRCQKDIESEAEILSELSVKLSQRNFLSLSDECTRSRLYKAAEELGPLTHQLNHAADIALNFRLLDTTNNTAGGISPAGLAIVDEHLDKVRDHWANAADELKRAIDEAVDKQVFMEAQSKGITHTTDQAESFILQKDAHGLARCTTNIARRANRVAQVANQEMENSADVVFVDRMSDAVTHLRGKITPMIMSAKGMLENMDERAYIDKWRHDNMQLCEAVGAVKYIIDTNQNPQERGYATNSVLNGPMSPLLLQQQQQQQQVSQQQLQQQQQDGHFHDTTHSSVLGQQVHPLPTAPQLTQEMSQLQINEVSDSTDNSPTKVDEDELGEEDCKFPVPAPREDEKIIAAAHTLHCEAQQWSSQDNEIVAAAKQISLLMAQLGLIVERGGDSKRELIQVAMAIAESSREVTRLGLLHAHNCTDKRIQKNLEEFCAQVSTVGTQLKILSTVKASMFGTVEASDEDDKQNTEMLVLNAENLMQSVVGVVRASEAASIKSRVDGEGRVRLRWVRKQPLWNQKPILAH